MGIASHKTGTIDHISEALQAWFQKILIFTGIIFQVCILNNEVFPLHFPDPEVNGSALAHIFRLVQYADSFITGFFQVFLQQIKGTVRGTVIYNDNFLLNPVGQFGCPDAVNDPVQKLFFIVAWYND
jgi:hypothetical protein